jgi:hypothetical protein
VGVGVDAAVGLGHVGFPSLLRVPRWTLGLVSARHARLRWEGPVYLRLVAANRPVRRDKAQKWILNAMLTSLKVFQCEILTLIGTFVSTEA